MICQGDYKVDIVYCVRAGHIVSATVNNLVAVLLFNCLNELRLLLERGVFF